MENDPKRLDSNQHPCFNAGVRHARGRIHLPVAPDCNIQCNYCNRLFDCVHESRPGVTSAVMEPEEVLPNLEHILRDDSCISVVGFAGPGDPFCEPEKILMIIEQVHNRFPHLLICASSNGLNVPAYVDHLARVGVTHVTLTINALNPKVGKNIYTWVKDQERIYTGREGAELLLSRQMEAVCRLKQRKIIVKVNTVVIPGINEGEVELIAKELCSLGVDFMNVISLYPVKQTPFGHLEEISPSTLVNLRNKAGRYLPQMIHCARCRADAVGLLENDQSVRFSSRLRRHKGWGSAESHQRQGFELMI